MTPPAVSAFLISFRDPGDPMIAHEHNCFRAVTGLPDIQLVLAIADLPAKRLLDEADLLFFGGSGTYGVNDDLPWLRTSLDFLLEVAARGVVAWASCFGFQGLTVALGGRVVRDDRRKRIGSHPLWLTPDAVGDPLFGELTARFYAQFGHHDHVEQVPSGVRVLATGEDERCLAFRVEGSNLWGGQFHPELDKTTNFERWDYYRALYEGGDGPEIDRHLREAADTPESRTVLPAIVQLAAQRRATR